MTCWLLIDTMHGGTLDRTERSTVAAGWEAEIASGELESAFVKREPSPLAMFTEDDIAEALSEAIWEADRIAKGGPIQETNLWVSFWDRLNEDIMDIPEFPEPRRAGE